MKSLTTSLIIVFIFAANLVYAAKTIIISGHPEYPPVAWQEGETIVGVGPEITKLIFEELGFTVNSKYTGSWSKVQENAQQGSIDVIAGVYISEQRTTFMDFSVPYMKDPVVVFVAKGKTFPYKTWDDLIQKNGAVTIGDSYGLEFDRFITRRLTTAKSLNVRDSFDKLLSGEADYLISAMYSGLIEAEKLGISDKIEYLPVYVTSNNFYIAISKESKYIKYLPGVNEKIEKFIKDGTIDKLIEEKMKYYMEGLRGNK